MHDPHVTRLAESTFFESAEDLRDETLAHSESFSVGEYAPAPQRTRIPHRASSDAYTSPRDRRKFLILLALLLLAGVAFAAGNLLWNNPMPFGTSGFWRIAQMRATSIVTIAVVACCQAVATIAFQTVTNNRIITPSIMGFESLYVTVHTAAVFFLGVTGVTAFDGLAQFGLKIILMVAFSLALYGWLLSGKYGNLQVMLLVGIIIGGGLGSLSAFMQRLLTPSEFDVLTAKLFGSVSNADASYFPVAVPLCVAATGALIWKSRTLNVMTLGKDVAATLGVDHKREVMSVLFLVSILMAVTTSLVGPMTFLGFLVATLAYQIAGTYDHRFIFLTAIITAFTVLGGAYFILKHVFYAEGAVSIIIEAVGGTAFLIMILRKGRL